MDKEFIIKLLKSNNRKDKLMGLFLVLDNKAEVLLSNITLVLPNGFIIDNNIVNINDILYNDIKVYFLGIKVLSELFESSLVITEDLPNG